MNATRGLLVLAGLVPMAPGPLDILVADVSAAEVQPVSAAHLVSAGTVAGTVVKVSPGHITVKVTETVTTPAPPRVITILNQRINVPQHHTKTVHRELTYPLAADASVRAVGARAGAPNPGLGGVHAGDAVAIHLSRTRTPVVTRVDVSAQNRK